jgi:hypothetical protein
VAASKFIGDPLTNGVNSLLDVLGVPKEYHQKSPSDAFGMLMDKLGIYRPRTAVERVVQAGTETASGGLGMVGLGKTLAQSATPDMAGVGEALAAQPAQQIIGGAGAGLASQAAVERGYGPGGQIVAGLGGGLIGGVLAPSPRPVPGVIPKGGFAPSMVGKTEPVAPVAAVEPLTSEALTTTAKKAAGGGLGSAKATQILAEQAVPNPKTVEAAKRLGIEEYLQPDHVTTNQAYRELTQAVKSIPGSAARSQEITGLRQVGARADKLISELGGTTDLSRMSDHVRSGISATTEQLTKVSDDAYARLRSQIPAQTRGPADIVLEFINQRAKDLDGAENLSSLEKNVLQKLSPKQVAEGDIKQPTYALIDNVRRDIGAAAKQSGPFADADTGLAKHLYKLIDQDQSAIASQAGLGAIYDEAKSAVRIRKGFEDDLVSIFGKKLDQSLVGKLETATKSLSKGDTDRFITLIKAIPPDMRKEVTASALNTAFGKSTQNGELNFNTFSRWYEGLLSNKQAHAALMTNLPPEARKRISDLYRVSRGVADATRERITTGRIQAIQQDFQEADSLLSTIYNTAKRGAIGAPIEVATSAMGLPGAGLAAGITSALMKSKTSAIKAADDLISSPDFLMLVKNPKTSEEAVRKVVASKPYQQYAKATGIPRDPNEGFRWLLNAIRGQQASNQVEGEKK